MGLFTANEQMNTELPGRTAVERNEPVDEQNLFVNLIDILVPLLRQAICRNPECDKIGPVHVRSRVGVPALPSAIQGDLWAAESRDDYC